MLTLQRQEGGTSFIFILYSVYIIEILKFQAKYDSLSSLQNEI